MIYLLWAVLYLLCGILFTVQLTRYKKQEDTKLIFVAFAWVLLLFLGLILALIKTAAERA